MDASIRDIYYDGEADAVMPYPVALAPDRSQIKRTLPPPAVPSGIDYSSMNLLMPQGVFSSSSAWGNVGAVPRASDVFVYWTGSRWQRGVAKKVGTFTESQGVAYGNLVFHAMGFQGTHNPTNYAATIADQTTPKPKGYVAGTTLVAIAGTQYLAKDPDGSVRVTKMVNRPEYYEEEVYNSQPFIVQAPIALPSSPNGMPDNWGQASTAMVISNANVVTTYEIIPLSGQGKVDHHAWIGGFIMPTSTTTVDVDLSSLTPGYTPTY